MSRNLALILVAVGSPWPVLTWGVVLTFTLGKQSVVWRMDCVLTVWELGDLLAWARRESGNIRQGGSREMLSGCI